MPTPSIATAISQPHLGDGDPPTQITLNRGEEGGLVPLGDVSCVVGNKLRVLDGPQRGRH